MAIVAAPLRAWFYKKTSITTVWLVMRLSFC
jgi:hypothetical protein